MAIVFPCDQCGQRYQVDDGFAGKRIKCKKCEKVLTIPSAAGAPPAAPRPASRPPLQTFGAPPASKPPLQSFGAPPAKAAPASPPRASSAPPQDLYGLDDAGDGGGAADPYGLTENYAPPKAPLKPDVDDDEEVALPRPGRPSGKKSKKRLQPAPFGKRWVAMFIDNMLLNGISWGIGKVGATVLPPEQPSTLVILLSLTVIVQIMYFGVLHASESQASLGKRAMHLKVCDTEGHRLSIGRSIVRETLKAFLVLFCLVDILVSFITILATAKKQALHDMPLGTMVVED
jgi:uncharacterized RDD family membrane protein YckC